MSGKIKIFPNPASTFLLAETGKYKIKSLKIFDITGKICKPNIVAEENIIDISNLQQGLYFLEIKTNKSTEVLRFIKK